MGDILNPGVDPEKQMDFEDLATEWAGKVEGALKASNNTRDNGESMETLKNEISQAFPEAPPVVEKGGGRRRRKSRRKRKSRKSRKSRRKRKSRKSRRRRKSKKTKRRRRR